jgi:hypothetical protein
MEFITKLGPQISLSLVPIFGVNRGKRKSEGFNFTKGEA